MKNLKLGKRGLALFTAACLLTGCGASEVSKSEEPEKEKKCFHLIINYGNEPVLFKECEGYDITYSIFRGTISYSIIDDSNTILSGSSSNYNIYEANHSYVDEIEEQVIENGGYVYKLK